MLFEALVLRLQAAQAVIARAQIQPSRAGPQRAGAVQVLALHRVGVLLHIDVGIFGEAACRRKQ